MITVKGDGLQRLQRSLRAVAGESVTATMRAVNYAAKRARTEASRQIRDQINLPARYVNENLKIEFKATRARLRSVISARTRPTRLARYGAKQLTRKAKGPAKGDPLRGIASGRKQAGVSVSVKRGGSRRKMRKAFLVPLRRGRMPGETSNMGVFIRTGRGKKDIKHLYGPSVDQLFRRIREELAPSIRIDLASEYARQMDLLTGKLGGR